MADGDYRGFVKNDPFVTLVHEGVGGAKVNGEVTGKEPFKHSPRRHSRRHDQQGPLRPLGSARTNTRTTKMTLFIGTSCGLGLSVEAAAVSRATFSDATVPVREGHVSSCYCFS
jgi:hypothetical protein